MGIKSSDEKDVAFRTTRWVTKVGVTLPLSKAAAFDWTPGD
jgi:hypothetical protein